MNTAEVHPPASGVHSQIPNSRQGMDSASYTFMKTVIVGVFLVIEFCDTFKTVVDR